MTEETEKAGKACETFAAFWPYYLQQHAHPKTRMWHYIGTGLAVLLLFVALIMQIWWLLLAVPIAGYLFAWLSHKMIEGNKPATFDYPLWSLLADLKMTALFVSGAMDKELKKHGITPKK